MRLRIAIDGPSGAGKSSVAKAIARSLDLAYLDTGAMYRAIGLKVKQRGVDPHDDQAVAEILADTDLTVSFTGEGQQIYLDGEALGEEIRANDIAQWASDVSTLPSCRRQLVAWQRECAMDHNVVIDGRDIASVVLPEAEVKIYLTADLHERAKRRWLELQSKQPDLTLEEVEGALQARDAQDQGRENSPLRCLPEHICIDSTDMTFEEVVNRILRLVQKQNPAYIAELRLERERRRRHYYLDLPGLSVPTLGEVDDDEDL